MTTTSPKSPTLPTADMLGLTDYQRERYAALGPFWAWLADIGQDPEIEVERERDGPTCIVVGGTWASSPQWCRVTITIAADGCTWASEQSAPTMPDHVHGLFWTVSPPGPMTRLLDALTMPRDTSLTDAVEALRTLPRAAACDGCRAGGDSQGHSSCSTYHPAWDRAEDLGIADAMLGRHGWRWVMEGDK